MKPTKSVPPDEARAFWVYDPISGSFESPDGESLGMTYSDGYVYISFNGVTYSAHRVAFWLVTGIWPRGLVDHINRDRSDNAFANLRPATYQQNNWNRVAKSGTASGIKGVYFDRRIQKWRAKITVSGKKRHLGSYKTPEEAGEAYKAASRKLHGAFSVFSGQSPS